MPKLFQPRWVGLVVLLLSLFKMRVVWKLARSIFGGHEGFTLENIW